jgi:hypothetical protein
MPCEEGKGAPQDNQERRVSFKEFNSAWSRQEVHVDEDNGRRTVVAPPRETFEIMKASQEIGKVRRLGRGAPMRRWKDDAKSCYPETVSTSEDMEEEDVLLGEVATDNCRTDKTGCGRGSKDQDLLRPPNDDGVFSERVLSSTLVKKKNRQPKNSRRRGKVATPDTTTRIESVDVPESMEAAKNKM